MAIAASSSPHLHRVNHSAKPSNRRSRCGCMEIRGACWASLAVAADFRHAGQGQKGSNGPPRFGNSNRGPAGSRIIVARIAMSRLEHLQNGSTGIDQRTDDRPAPKVTPFIGAGNRAKGSRPLTRPTVARISRQNGAGHSGRSKGIRGGRNSQTRRKAGRYAGHDLRRRDVVGHRENRGRTQRRGSRFHGDGCLSNCRVPRDAAARVGVQAPSAAIRRTNAVVNPETIARFRWDRWAAR